ncbi:MAG: hypothetical protein P1U57_13490 [Oleibacter sp.]|jgi:hypothetical protein|nr:hypothetical protein [Cycloclasticus sp.]MDF1764417.1 hypothetical protein [Thalassolituus sp.]
MDNSNLVRKQVMLSDSNISKLNKISKKENVSVASVIRIAIDAYNPEINDEDSELIELVSARLKEAVEDTQQTRKRLNKTLLKLERDQ